MNMIGHREYTRLRAKGWHAQQALRAANTAQEWHRYEYNGVHTPVFGDVRMRVEPDDMISMDNLKGDMFTRKYHPEIPEARMAREEKEFEERVERLGVCGIVGEYFDGSEWQHADAVWGFVGDDWKDSGYDVDIMRSALDAAQKCRDAALLVGAV